MTFESLITLLLFGLPGDAIGGLVLTTLVFVAAALAGALLGAIYAVACAVSKTLAWPLMAASALLRGVPPIILVFGLAHTPAVPLTVAGMLGLALYSFSHVGETLRGYLYAYPREQAEAAKVAGMHPVWDWLILRLGWSIRRALPAVATHWISLIKDTGALVIVGIGELTTVAKLAAESTASVSSWMLALGLAGALYFAATCVLLLGLRRLDRWLNAPSRSKPCEKTAPQSHHSVARLLRADY